MFAQSRLESLDEIHGLAGFRTDVTSFEDVRHARRRDSLAYLNDLSTTVLAGIFTRFVPHSSFSIEHHAITSWIDANTPEPFHEFVGRYVGLPLESGPTVVAEHIKQMRLANVVAATAVQQTYQIAA